MSIGYKKCFDPETKNSVLVELEIPEDADKKGPDKSSYFSILTISRKCRASKAIVKKIHGGCKIAVSMYDNSFTYEVDKVVTGKDLPWEDNSHICGNGIHYFEDKKMAIRYMSGSYMFDGGDENSPSDFWRQTPNKPKVCVYYLIEDAINDDAEADKKAEDTLNQETLKTAKEYYIVYKTVGSEAETEVGTYATEEAANDVVREVTKNESTTARFLKVIKA